MKRRDDIALIPHFYHIKWAVDLNLVLSELFYVPDRYKIAFREKSYLRGKSQLHEYISYLLPDLRSKNIKKVFYCNILDDFSADIEKAGFINQYAGILHASNHQNIAVGQNKRLVDYENFICGGAKQIITGSKYLDSLVPYKTTVTGLPVQTDMKKPSNKKGIFFSHRLMNDKNVNMLFDLPDKYNDKITVTCPSGSTTYIGMAKRKFPNFYYRLPVDQYYSKMNDCGFGLSFAVHDNFGYSMLEGIFSGLTYLVLDTETTTCREFILDDLRFTSIDDFNEKYEYYCNNPVDRANIVKKQQSIVRKHHIDHWLKRFKKELAL